MYYTYGNDITLNYTLTVTPSRSGWVYKIHLAEEENVTSHIDQIKLSIIIDGSEVALPFISANHSDGNNIRRPLRFSDDIRTSISYGESIDASFLALPFPNITDFVFQIEGYSE